MKLLIGVFIMAAVITAVAKLMFLKGERWWLCAWCRNWFSDRGNTSKDMPYWWDGTVSHGLCTDCHHNPENKLPAGKQVPAGSMKD